MTICKTINEKWLDVMLNDPLESTRTMATWLRHNFDKVIWAAEHQMHDFVVVLMRDTGDGNKDITFKLLHTISDAELNKITGGYYYLVYRLELEGLQVKTEDKDLKPADIPLHPKLEAGYRNGSLFTVAWITHNNTLAISSCDAFQEAMERYRELGSIDKLVYDNNGGKIVCSNVVMSDTKADPVKDTSNTLSSEVAEEFKKRCRSLANVNAYQQVLLKKLEEERDFYAEHSTKLGNDGKFGRAEAFKHKHSTICGLIKRLPHILDTYLHTCKVTEDTNS